MSGEDRVFTPHTPKQEQFIFSEHRISVAATGIQWGKGLTLDGKVLTPSGYVLVRDIQVGSTLIDRNGNPTLVAGVYPQGLQECYKISFTDRKSLVTDGSHRNILQRRSGRREVVMSTRELFESEHLFGKAQVPSVQPIQMPKAAQSVISAYALGVLLGDGTFKQDYIGLAKADLEVVERIRNEMPDFELKAYTEHTYGLVQLGRPGNRAIDELRCLGLMGKGSQDKFIPENYLYGSIDQRLALLQGLMDTDGTVSVNNPKIEFDSSSPRLAKGVIWLVESLGGKAWMRIKETYYRDRDGNKIACKPGHRVNIILPGFNPFYLKRKADRWFRHENTTNKVIKSVERAGQHETVCFEVDSETKSFVANDQIVTHNSEGGAVRCRRMLHRFTSPNDAFIVAAPTYPIMQQATLPTFLEFCGDLGEYHKGDKIFETYWGAQVYFRTGTVGDSVVGIRNTRHIWIDEGGLCSLYFWENLQGRAAPKEATIDITTSPYSLNWVYKELIKPALEGKRDDVCLVQAQSRENPYFPEAEYLLRKKTMDPRRFNLMFGGEWGRREGIVYDCLSDIENITEMSRLPPGMRYFAGIDWGYTQEFSLVVIACDGDDIYVVANVKKSRLTMSSIKDLVGQFQKMLNIELFLCGPDQPGSIRELNMVPGVRAAPAINDILAGIGVVYDLILARKLKFVEGKCDYVLDELEMYHFPEPKDVGVDKDEKEQNPVKQNDHSLDALRYVVVTTRNILTMRGPFTPDALAQARTDQRARIKRLLTSNVKPRTEKWT